MMLILLLAVFLASSPVLQAPGQAASIVSIDFRGNKNVAQEELKAQLRMTREGGRYRPEVLGMDLRNLESFYHDQGFLRASVESPEIEFRPMEGGGQGAVIRVTVKEGPVYTLGKLDILHVTQFDLQTLIQMAPVRPGQPYGRGKMAAWINKIRDDYNTLGFIRFDAGLREDIDDASHTVDCLLECREGNAYKVGRILVEGDKSVDPVEFKKRLLLSEGSLYNPQMLATTLYYLNNARLYRRISLSDVEMRIDDAAGSVDLVFRVFLLKKPSELLETPLTVPPLRLPACDGWGCGASFER